MDEQHKRDDDQDLYQDLFLMEDSPETVMANNLSDSSSDLFSPEGDSIMPSQVDEQIYLESYKQKTEAEGVFLPLLGNRPAATHVRILAGLFFVFMALTIGLGIYALTHDSTTATQPGTSGTLQLNAARLSRSAQASMMGDAAALAELKNSHESLTRSLQQLRASDNSKATAIQQKLGDTLNEDVRTVAQQQATLQPLASAMQSIPADVDATQKQIDTLKRYLMQRNAPASQTIAVGDMAMLVERIEKSASALPIRASIAPEDLHQLGKDLVTIDGLLNALATGDSTLAIAPLQDAEKETLGQLIKAYAPLKTKVSALLEQEKAFATQHQALGRIMAGVQAATPDILALGAGTAPSGTTIPLWLYAAIVGSALLALLSGSGIVYVQLSDTRRMQKQAEDENNRNQAAILRLMNELQNVADGDLTRETTVSEEITGAIADSINSTVEEWRLLVGNVQATADQVAQTTANVELTSAALLDASAEQLQEIRNTGQSVLEMAQRINAASYQAKDSALVAMRSRQAAADGYQAVQNSIDGMNIIRDQIQDTAKRIKRLGESSQEIGEITELISDITEQTNVLALNAAIQAASAGEAGRGFSVVAEEVQRLAERSAEATKQIAALVKTIQTDTHDAVAAMERSTQEVVQGAHLSDNAGKALDEIDRVSRQLSDLIQKISATTSEEAKLANTVAGNIQQIFTVTEHATEGTRTTAQAVGELARVAQKLRASIARFKIK